MTEVGPILVRNATWRDGSTSDIRIRNGMVAEIGDLSTTSSDPGTTEIDATGQLVVPGLVEAHCHLDKTLFGRAWVPHTADDTLASRIATDRFRRFELGLPDPVAIRALLTRMIATGTSLVRTHTDVDPEVGLDGIHRVLAVSEELATSVRVQLVAFPQHGLLSLPGTEDLLRAALEEGAGVVGGLDPTSDGDAAAYLDVIFALAERAGAQIDLHLHSHGDVGVREIELIVERTLALDLRGRVAVSHAYCFGDLDADQSQAVAEQLASAGVSVVIAAPYSFPVPPIRALTEAGVVVACGHDGIRDLWGPYGTADMLDRVRHIASRAGFRQDTDIELVLDAATAGGRRLITGEPGDIAVGRVADFLLVPASCSAEAVVTVPPERSVIRGPLD